MALDRLVPVSTTPGAVKGDAFMDAAQEELTGLWNRSCILLSGVGGTANAITASVTPAINAGLQSGMMFLLTPASNNTLAVTLKLDSEPPYAVVDKDQVALAASDLLATRTYLLLFLGSISSFIVLTEVGDVSIPTSYVDTQQFTGSGTWTRPSRANAESITRIFGWGAGGGGGAGATGAGGGGGERGERWVPTLSLGATETVTIPGGGAIGVAGGNATFGTWLTCYGGGAGNSTGGGGGGGGNVAAGANGTLGGGSPGGAGGGLMGGAGGSAGVGGSSLSGGGGATLFAGGTGIDGGGGGAGGGASGSAGGQSLRGGGGGGGGSGGTGGSSTEGGSGGNVGSAGAAPAGGGGGNAAGGRGEIWVITFI